MGQLDCNSDLSNTGSNICRENFGMVKRLWVVPNGSAGEVAARASALLEATWVTMINAATSADRMRPLQKIFAIETNNEETLYDDGSDGDKDFVREGRYDRTYTLRVSLCELKKLRSLNNNSALSCYEVSANGYIKGTTDGTKFAPFSISLLSIEKQTDDDGTTRAKVKVRVIGADPTEWNDRGWWVKPTAFNPLTDIDGIVDVDLEEVGTSTATATVFTVKTDCGEVPQDSWVKADFLLVNSDGVSQVAKITSITSNGDGQYTCVWDTLSADTYTLTTSGVGTMTTTGFADTGGFDFTIGE